MGLFRYFTQSTGSIYPSRQIFTKFPANYDTDTVPENTVLSDSTGNRGTVDAIIDPTTFNPQPLDSSNAGLRYLILKPIQFVS